MRRIGLAVVLALTLLAPAPLGVEAQHTAKMYHIGVLALLPGEDATLLKSLRFQSDIKIQ